MYIYAEDSGYHYEDYAKVVFVTVIRINPVKARFHIVWNGRELH